MSHQPKAKLQLLQGFVPSKVDPSISYLRKSDSRSQACSTNQGYKFQQKSSGIVGMSVDLSLSLTDESHFHQQVGTGEPD